jgi:hypothetical protein
MMKGFWYQSEEIGQNKNPGNRYVHEEASGVRHFLSNRKQSRVIPEAFQTLNQCGVQWGFAVNKPSTKPI